MKRLFLCTCVLLCVCAACGSSSQPKEASAMQQPQNSQSQQQMDQTTRGSASDICKQYQNLCITSPTDGAAVSPTTSVMGIVAEPEASVWVIVHPTKTGGFWVQPPVTITKDAKGNVTWNVDIYIGDDKTPSGTTFEIMAVANPKEAMAEGLKLTEWPKGTDVKWKSNVVKVTRQ